MKVISRRDGTVAVLAVANPPVNALSIRAGVIDALRTAVDAAIEDGDVAAIVIAGEGRMFSAGADIADFDSPPATLDRFRDLLLRIEHSPKPVVMAIHAVALGGALELALSGHYRIATEDSRLGLPEVTLGVLPGGGGTQRLPRLAGFARAIPMMVGGGPVSAREALEIGLVDAVVDGDPVAGALAFIAGRSPLPPRPTGALPVPPGGAEAVAAARARLKPGALNQAPAKIVDCAEQVFTTDFASGLAFEAAGFSTLAATEGSKGLRHAFFGERKVAQIPGLPRETAPLPIDRVGIVGGGLMGTGIAIAMLNAGLPVTLVEPRAEGRDKAAAKIAVTIGRDAEKGRISRQEADRRITLLTITDAMDAVADADLVIEAVFEEMTVKEGVVRALDRIAKPGAILASNTSMLDLDVIAGFTGRPDHVVGLHFFSPANIMKLLEIVRGRETAPVALATALALARRIGKTGVIAGNCDGFIGNRMFEEYLRQAYFLAEEGALPQQIDAALEAWGMAMGPYRTLDLAGQDVAWSVRKRRAVDQPDRPYSCFLDRLCEQGRFGQKTGAGVYLYADGRTAEIDPEMETLLLAHSAEKGIARRPIGDREIVERCLFAMINEGARIVAEGMAYRPVDADIVYLKGYGFPAERGGPMHYADRIGLPVLLDALRTLSTRRNGWAFEPAPLIVDLAARGDSFETLNG
ncbi:3-hydroxyacyl-CoA dehydrogenase NAD-binding domain-containing protein [Flavisphingomonas formosensis]|uniref:3-hydroxyacyl-CoA dehydrogenase NAD-binding domain-containing protein n=1 Tax=Flavisphingomonas formosensis TaxID=861534 RepID=UPI0012F81B3B|nr:3-hydroxyacyl-CoA dehydrogenase NAD-binding domain-containing protein [Sphingomonas formosensis]